MKSNDATMALLDKLRAKGVTRVEFQGDDISALDFGTVPEVDGEKNTTPDVDASTAPYEAAIRQMRVGSFARGEG